MAHAGCETKTNEMMRVLSTFETCEVVKRLQNLERERRESWRRPEDIFCGAPPLTLLLDDSFQTTNYYSEYIECELRPVCIIIYSILALLATTKDPLGNLRQSRTLVPLLLRWLGFGQRRQDLDRLGPRRRAAGCIHQRALRRIGSH